MISIVCLNIAARKFLGSDLRSTTYPKRGRGKKYTIEKVFSPSTAGGALSSALPPEQAFILDLAISLEYSGREKFTALDILALAKGQERVTKSAFRSVTIRSIEESLLSLRNISLIVKRQRGEEIAKGLILPIFKESVEEVKLRDGAYSLVTWSFVSDSPSVLLSEAERLKGLITYPLEAMNIGRVNGLKNGALKKWLLDKVYTGAAQRGKYKKRGCRIELKYLEAAFGAVTPMQRKRLRALVFRLLDSISSSPSSPLSAYTVTGKAKESINLKFKGGK